VAATTRAKILPGLGPEGMDFGERGGRLRARDSIRAAQRKSRRGMARAGCSIFRSYNSAA
jgi:hypothetical protein